MLSDCSWWPKIIVPRTLWKNTSDSGRITLPSNRSCYGKRRGQPRNTMNGKSTKNVFHWFRIEFLISFVSFFSLVFVDHCVVFFNVRGNRSMPSRRFSWRLWQRRIVFPRFPQAPVAMSLFWVDVSVTFIGDWRNSRWSTGKSTYQCWDQNEKRKSGGRTWGKEFTHGCLIFSR